VTEPRWRWLGHSSIHLPGPPALAADPWRWRDDSLKADVVLVTHAHADHCSEDDIAAASHGATAIVAPQAAASRLRETFGGRVVEAREGQVLEFAGARVAVLPAEGPARARSFHPRGHGVAYLAETSGVRHLFLGDSDALPEHEGLAPDVAWFAVGGLAVMDPEEAADAAARIRPGVAVPVHWGDLNGRFDLAATFATLCAARGVRAQAKPPKE
jgi:L-ascorbate metabolism protein UlaG (beta-lactamase superfamily)